MQIEDCRVGMKVTSIHNKSVEFYVVIKVGPQTVDIKAPKGHIDRQTRPEILREYEE